MFSAESPSLRGSGLKFPPGLARHNSGNVSLFTREWIEIPGDNLLDEPTEVSLFTREWIEIEYMYLTL